MKTKIILPVGGGLGVSGKTGVLMALNGSGAGRGFVFMVSLNIFPHWENFVSAPMASWVMSYRSCTCKLISNTIMRVFMAGYRPK